MRIRKKTIFIAMLIIMVFLENTVIAATSSSSANKWMKNTGISANDLNDVAYGNGTYVAVGNDGTIETSSDGLRWVSVSAYTIGNLYSVVFNGKIFLVTGEQGNLLSSNDGKMWKKVSYPVTIGLTDFYSAKSLKSDGIDPTKKYTSSDITFEDMIWDGKQFVIIAGVEADFNDLGYRGNIIMTSPNGATWSMKPLTTQSNRLSTVDKLVFDGKQFVVLGTEYNKNNDEIPVTLFSKDTNVWTMKENNISGSVNDISYNGSTYVAVGWDGGMNKLSGTILTSKDAVSWTQRKTDKSWNGRMDDKGLLCASVNRVLWTGSKFIAGAKNGVLLDSPDGTSWHLFKAQTGRELSDSMFFITTNETVGLDANVQGIALNGSQIVAVGSFDSKLVSDSGSEWKDVSSNTGSDLNRVGWTGKFYISVGRFGRILKSLDGKSWEYARVDGSSRPSKAGNRNVDFKGLAWNSAGCIAIGEDIGDYKIFFSEDGSSWRNVYTYQGNCDAKSLSWDGQQYLIRTKSGILTSGDGMTWKQETVSTYKGFYKGAQNGTLRIAINDSGSGESLLYSADGKTWNDTKQYTTGHFTSVTANGKIFVAVASYGKLYTSTDGRKWSEVTLNIGKYDNDLNSAVWDGKRFVCVGKQGIMITSSDGSKWTRVPSVTRNDLNFVYWDGKMLTVVGNANTIINCYP
jgi:hypothetical protein